VNKKFIKIAGIIFICLFLSVIFEAGFKYFFVEKDYSNLLIGAISIFIGAIGVVLTINVLGSK
jgi:hypothetical protein